MKFADVKSVLSLGRDYTARENAAYLYRQITEKYQFPAKLGETVADVLNAAGFPIGQAKLSENTANAVVCYLERKAGL